MNLPTLVSGRSRGRLPNLVVADRARSEGAPISFWRYFKVGLPLTLVTLAAGTAWLAWR